VTHAPPPHTSAYPPPAVAPNGAPLAEYSDRAVAFIIDYAILLTVGLVITIPAFVYQFAVMDDWARELRSASDRGNPPDFGDIMRGILPLVGVSVVVLVLNLAIFYVYRVEMMFRSGQTVGKRSMRIRVVPLDPSATLTRPTAVRRWLVDSLGAQIVPLLFWLDGLWQYWDKPYRQCLHDKVAGTVVVKVGS